MKAIITLAVTVLLAATAIGADVVTKGGATKLFQGPAVQKDVAVTAPMLCPKCKSDFVQSTTTSPKGNAPVTTIVERHACSGCGTKWVTTGQGKAKLERPAHTCSGCRS